MTETVQAQIEKLRLSIQGLEAQRAALGNEIVAPALAALQQQLTALEQQVVAKAAPGEERRMVSILFIDMVGSTSIAEKLDPEEWRQVIKKIHTAIGESITTHHGIVAQFLGDGLLAFFGSRETSEHDPENAIRAALEIISKISSLPLTEKVQLRAGIHTGLVVVGELGDASHSEFTASGDAVNLAARLQSAAPTGGILISHDTYRYVRGVFDLTPHPPLSIKGKSEPVQTYLVRRAKPRPFRSVTRGVAGIETRTIGRTAEMQALQEAYLRTYQGHGLVWVQLLSDPGVGKSRLMVDLTDWLDLREEVFRLLRARAFPDDVNQPFALIQRIWFDRFQISEDAPLEAAQSKWVERFKELSGLVDFEEPSHALGLLAGLPFKDSPHIKGLRNDPTQVKGRAFVVSRDLINAVRQNYPVVVLLEDMQWTDYASWEYLMEVFLRETNRNLPHGIFILGAARPEWHPPEELTTLLESSGSGEISSGKWGSSIRLAPLTSQETHDLALEILQRVEDVPEQVISLLVERSEGVPYFTEEIVNWFIDHEILDTHSEQWRFIPEKLKSQPLPSTLQNLLFTRLSSLSQPERSALQRGSIFGRRFWTGGVEALGVASGEETLGHLQPRGFVQAQPESVFEGDTEWSFHHNLLQEVTYESVLKRERADLHKVAAGWLESQARKSDRLDEFAGLLGDHYERAGEYSRAANWYLLAGKRAMSQGAVREARGFYTRALDLLPPADKEPRWQALLGRQEALGVLGEADSWKADIISLVELARTFENENYLAEAFLRQAIYGARATNEVLIDQALREGLAIAHSCQNETIEAKLLAMQAARLIATGNIPGAIETIEEALRRARRLKDDNVLAFVLFQAAFCYSEMGEVSKASPLQMEQVEVDHQLGNRHQELIGLGNQASTYLAMGLYKQARSDLEQAIRICRDLGARRPLAYGLMNLADVYLALGEIRKAHHLAVEALEVISPSQDARGITFALDDLGRILLAMGDPQGADRRFTEALDLAVRRGQTGLPLECESKIYLAASKVMQGELQEAESLILPAWDYLREHGFPGMGNPSAVYRNCVETFDALGDIEHYLAALETSCKVILDFADKLTIPEWRQAFLEAVPDNRALLEMWERSKG